MNEWEIPGKPMSDINNPYDVAVLLGGSLKYYNSETKRPVFSGSVDRLMQTISLYKNKKVKKILLSGGSGRITMPDERESEIVLQVLLEADIPAEDIILENNSRNTYENAVMSAKILKTQFPGKRILLVTSAFHMRRSLACFRKAGIQADPYPVDEKSGKGTFTPDRFLIPDSECLSSWDSLLHEWVGFLIYKLYGYA